MLASLLPGLRDLRVPLSAGFMWLAVLWLAFYPFLPSRSEATGLLAEVYRLLGYFGLAGLTATLTFVAYLLGILVVMVVSLLIGERLLLDQVSRSTRAEANNLVAEAGERYAIELARYDREVEQLKKREGTGRPSLAAPDPGRVEQLTGNISREIPLMGVRLLSENRDLYDVYDRADAEAKFRFHIALPVLTIGILLPIRLGAAGWLYPIIIGVSVILVLLLIADGLRKTRASNEAVWQAVFIGAVSIPSLDELRRETKLIRDFNDKPTLERSAFPRVAGG